MVWRDTWIHKISFHFIKSVMDRQTRGVNHWKNLVSIACKESLESHRNLRNLIKSDKNLRNLIRIFGITWKSLKNLLGIPRISENLCRILTKIQNRWNLGSKYSTDSPLGQTRFWNILFAFSLIYKTIIKKSVEYIQVWFKQPCSLFLNLKKFAILWVFWALAEV